MKKSGEKNSVLIVDDEKSNILILINILGPEYTVFASTDGREAVEIAEKSLPDVILLDVIMPDMDGYAVIGALKKSEKTRDIPVIFITGLDGDEAEKKGLDLGAVDYISKPFYAPIVKIRIDNQIKIVNNTRLLNERLQQQALMTKISHSFLTDAYVDAIYADTLSMVGEFMGIAQVLLYKLEEDESAFICQNEWRSPELKLETRVGEKLQLDAKHMSNILALRDSRKEDRCLYSSNPVVSESFAPFRKHFHNYIATPIFVKGKVKGILDFSQKVDGVAWSESETDLAVLVSGVFSGAFERDAMERQFSMVEHSPNLGLYITVDAAVDYANPAVTAVTGYTKTELLTRGLGAIFGESTLTDIKEQHIPAVKRDETVMFEAEVTCKNGDKRILITSLFKAENNNFGMITSDITETRDLEAGLAVAKELAEYLSRAKSEFLSRMSHELRNPMNAIMGMLRIIKLRGVPDSIKDYVEKIETASRQMLQMIDDVLDMSGMEYGTFKLADLPFDVGGMFGKALQKAVYNASVKHQTIASSFDPAIPETLIGDEKRLKLVIDNLLSNAIKFTPEQGEISLSAGVINEDDKTVTLQIEIADNGIGMSQDQQRKLFHIFEQMDSANGRKYGGIGIGLSLSKLIIDMMGGTTEVESELNKGSKFTFTCNLKKV